MFIPKFTLRVVFQHESSEAGFETSVGSRVPARTSGMARQIFGQGLWELDRLDGRDAGDLTHVAETPDQIAARSRNAHLRFVLKA